jgi:hypothetical protein
MISLASALVVLLLRSCSSFGAVRSCDPAHGMYCLDVFSVLTPLLWYLPTEIEAPVRDSIPDGGPPIRERENELDREIVASDGNRCGIRAFVRRSCTHMCVWFL